MQVETTHQDISKEDLLRLKKPEIVELFVQLQEYTKKIEEATRGDFSLVRVDEKVFFDDAFLGEFTAFIAEISTAEPFIEKGREYSSNWVKIEGRLRPNYPFLKITNEHGADPWLREVSPVYMIPSNVAAALKSFAHALRNRQSELSEEYEKKGKHFLVQMLKNDLIGEASK